MNEINLGQKNFTVQLWRIANEQQKNRFNCNMLYGYFQLRYGNCRCVWEKNYVYGNVDHAEEIIRSLRKNEPLNKYYYRNSTTNEKNYPSAPNAVFEYGKARYIETARNQKYKICLENRENGFWEGLVPFQLTKNNCLLLTTPNRTGSLLFVFFNDSVPSDSVWILNNQKLIDLSKETHLIWSIDSIIGPEYKRRVYGSYKETRLNKILVVDRMEATVGEVKFLCDYFGTFYRSFNLWYPDGNPLIHPNLPQDPSYAVDSDYANKRSKLEGFEIASRANGADTTKNGYRLPTHDEWVALQRGGSKKEYYWGNETDSLTISQYEWYKPRKERVHEVGLLKPNPYGLYDVMGNATESILYQGRECLSSDESSNECWMKNNLVQHEAEEFCYTHIKYEADKENTFVKECDLRYKKNPFRGFRLVRQIFIND